jgi:hypothetical protein
MRKHDATNDDYLWIPKDELRAELRKFLSTEMEKRDCMWNKILYDALSVFIEMLALYNREAANRMAKRMSDFLSGLPPRSPFEWPRRDRPPLQ